MNGTTRWCVLRGFRRSHAVRMTPAGYERSYCGHAAGRDEDWVEDVAGRLPHCKRCASMLRSRPVPVGGSDGSEHI